LYQCRSRFTPKHRTDFAFRARLIVMRAAFGAFTAPLYPTCTKTNANWIPVKNRARATGFANAGAGFGGAVSPILFTCMIGHYS
jgi:MFS family permease